MNSENLNGFIFYSKKGGNLFRKQGINERRPRQILRSSPLHFLLRIAGEVSREKDFRI